MSRPIITDEDGIVRESIEGWEIVCYGKGDSSACFEDKSRQGGLTGQVDADGVTFDVRDDERGRGYDGDCAGSRTAPLAVVIRAAEIYAWARDFEPVVETRNGVKLTYAEDHGRRRLSGYDCACMGRDNAPWYIHGAKYDTCPNVTERKPVEQA